MRFSALQHMVDFLAEAGVDTDFAKKEVWGESPVQLFDKHLKGEIEFRFLPGTRKLALFSKRLKGLIFAGDELLVETMRVYPSGKVVLLYDESISVDQAVQDGKIWSYSETIRYGEVRGLYEEISVTASRVLREEFGLNILDPLELLKPLGTRYRRRASIQPATHHGRQLLDAVMATAISDPPRPSTIYPLPSVVTSVWYESQFDPRPANASQEVFRRNDEGVEIYRRYIPYPW